MLKNNITNFRFQFTKKYARGRGPKRKIKINN